MKIGILTHHYIVNYGAFLQMKSLIEVLKSIYPGAEVKVINYVVGRHFRKNRIYALRPKRTDTLRSYSEKIKRLRTLVRYAHSVPLTKRVRSAQDIRALGFDLIVIGSDEVWNVYDGYSPLKFGVGLEDRKIIAYAPSVGSVSDETAVPQDIVSGMKNIGRISGRDAETVKFIRRITDRKAIMTLDPTLLYSFEEEMKKEQIRKKQFRYILLYGCVLTDEMVRELVGFAGEHNYRILGAGEYRPYCDEFTVNLTPYEWIDLFRNASLVVTGTFHGTVFSIKYRKPFVCYPTQKNRLNKVDSLLQDMGLSERLLRAGQEREFRSLLSRETDYSSADDYILTKTQESLAFLSSDRSDLPSE